MSVFEYSNPHPKGLHTTDCVVRAVALAFDKDYLESRRELNKSKKELGFGSYKETKFIYEYLKAYDRIILKVPKVNQELKLMTLQSFSKREPMSLNLQNISHVLKMVSY